MSADRNHPADLPHRSPPMTKTPERLLMDWFDNHDVSLHGATHAMVMAAARHALNEGVDPEPVPDDRSVVDPDNHDDVHSIAEKLYEAWQLSKIQSGAGPLSWDFASRRTRRAFDAVAAEAIRQLGKRLVAPPGATITTSEDHADLLRRLRILAKNFDALARWAPSDSAERDRMHDAADSLRRTMAGGDVIPLNGAHAEERLNLTAETDTELQTLYPETEQNDGRCRCGALAVDPADSCQWHQSVRLHRLRRLEKAGRPQTTIAPGTTGTATVGVQLSQHVTRHYEGKRVIRRGGAGGWYVPDLDAFVHDDQVTDFVPDPDPLALYQLVNAIVHTVEYVGNDTLPAIEGWSWFDALTKYAPEAAQRFVDHPQYLHKNDPPRLTAEAVEDLIRPAVVIGPATKTYVSVEDIRRVLAPYVAKDGAE